MNERPIRLLVVDDSLLARTLIRQSLDGCPDIMIVGFASDPYDARHKIIELQCLGKQSVCERLGRYWPWRKYPYLDDPWPTPTLPSQSL